MIYIYILYFVLDSSTKNKKVENSQNMGNESSSVYRRNLDTISKNHLNLNRNDKRFNNQLIPSLHDYLTVES